MTGETEGKIRVVTVDDEDLARQVLREFLSAHPEIEIAGECANGSEAVKTVAETKPALVFLDIQMPKLDGFEVLDLIGNDAAVVFVTSHDAYAIRAFEVHAVDYLLKPVAKERFESHSTAPRNGSAGEPPRSRRARCSSRRQRGLLLNISNALPCGTAGGFSYSRLEARLPGSTGRLRCACS